MADGEERIAVPGEAWQSSPVSLHYTAGVKWDGCLWSLGEEEPQESTPGTQRSSWPEPAGVTSERAGGKEV